MKNRKRNRLAKRSVTKANTDHRKAVEKGTTSEGIRKKTEEWQKNYMRVSGR